MCLCCTHRLLHTKSTEFSLAPNTYCNDNDLTCDDLRKSHHYANSDPTSTTRTICCSSMGLTQNPQSCDIGILVLGYSFMKDVVIQTKSNALGHFLGSAKMQGHRGS